MGRRIPYVCRCGAKGVKLWREYQTIASATDLYCVDCAGKSQKRDVSAVDLFGRVADKHCGPCDQIGWLVPAVPTDDGRTFWGYTSVPNERVEWWRGLPNREGEAIVTRNAIAARLKDGPLADADAQALLFLLDEATKGEARFRHSFMRMFDDQPRAREVAEKAERARIVAMAREAAADHQANADVIASHDGAEAWLERAKRDALLALVEKAEGT